MCCLSSRRHVRIATNARVVCSNAEVRDALGQLPVLLLGRADAVLQLQLPSRRSRRRCGARGDPLRLAPLAPGELQLLLQRH